MCGIVGVIDKNKQTTVSDIKRMSACLSHRGPDDYGLYQDSEYGISLAHQRLSLIDLSPSGHQPMEIDDHVIVYNGEIYNYKEIRKELESFGIVFSGESDTEVLLRGWQKWGEKVIDKCRGMFAFAILNKKTRELEVYRDRFGVKPIYYFYDNKIFIFASELKALILHPAVRKKINTEAVGLFLQLGYVPAPYSIYKNIFKLEPAHRLKVTDALHVTKERYWYLGDFYKQESRLHDKQEILSSLEKKLKEACSLRMIADVPVGVFLSGGIDSSLVTALLVQQGYANVSTFTIGFQESSHNEAEYAKKVAKYLGTKHHEHFCTTKEAQEIIPKLPEIYDEPFADASAIPTYLLSQFAKQRVTAALSADGGDELFGGYTRYQSGENIYTKFARFPGVLYPFILIARRIVMGLSQARILPTRYAHKFAKALLFYRVRNKLANTYAVQHSYFTDQEIDYLLVRPTATNTTNIFVKYETNKVSHLIRRLQHIDAHTYLPDDILTKVDRATMANSLESREPLLDHQVWEYVAGLSDSQLCYGQSSKHLLREILYKHIPRELIDRPKQGFGVPLDDWLRNDLRYLIDEHLSREQVEQAGLLDYQAVAQERDKFFYGKQSYNRIWNILILHMWYKQCFN